MRFTHHYIASSTDKRITLNNGLLKHVLWCPNSAPTHFRSLLLPISSFSPAAILTHHSVQKDNVLQITLNGGSVTQRVEYDTPETGGDSAHVLGSHPPRQAGIRRTCSAHPQPSRSRCRAHQPWRPRAACDALPRPAAPLRASTKARCESQPEENGAEGERRRSATARPRPIIRNRGGIVVRRPATASKSMNKSMIGIVNQ